MQHKTIFKNTIFQTLAKIITAGIGFILTILIARSFGPSGFGDFTQITAFVTLFYLVIDFGFNAIFLQTENSFSQLFSFRLLWSAGVFLIVCIIAFFLPFNPHVSSGFSPLVKAGIFLFSLSFFSQSMLLSATAVFQKKQQYEYPLLAQTIGSIMTLVLVAAGIAASLPLLFVIFCYLAGNAISACVSLWFTRDHVKNINGRISGWKSLLAASWPLGLMLVFNLIYFRIDTIILSVFKTSTDVGIYGISYQFFDFLLALPLFLSNSLYPALLAKKENKKELFALIRQYFFIYLLASCVFLLLFWFISPLFALIRPEFSRATGPFRILLLGLPLFFTTSFLQWVLITLKKQKFLLLVYFFSMIFNIILNIIFIPQFSYNAAAVITGISEGVVFVFLFGKVIQLGFATHE